MIVFDPMLSLVSEVKGVLIRVVTVVLAVKNVAVEVFVEFEI